MVGGGLPLRLELGHDAAVVGQQRIVHGIVNKVIAVGQVVQHVIACLNGVRNRLGKAHDRIRLEVVVGLVDVVVGIAGQRADGVVEDVVAGPEVVPVAFKRVELRHSEVARLVLAGTLVVRSFRPLQKGSGDFGPSHGIARHQIAHVLPIASSHAGAADFAGVVALP